MLLEVTIVVMGMLASSEAGGELVPASYGSRMIFQPRVAGFYGGGGDRARYGGGIYRTSYEDHDGNYGRDRSSYDDEPMTSRYGGDDERRYGEVSHYDRAYGGEMSRYREAGEEERATYSRGLGEYGRGVGYKPEHGVTYRHRGSSYDNDDNAEYGHSTRAYSRRERGDGYEREDNYDRYDESRPDPYDDDDVDNNYDPYRAVYNYVPGFILNPRHGNYVSDKPKMRDIYYNKCFYGGKVQYDCFPYTDYYNFQMKPDRRYAESVGYGSGYGRGETRRVEYDVPRDAGSYGKPAMPSRQPYAKKKRTSRVYYY